MLKNCPQENKELQDFTKNLYNIKKLQKLKRLLTNKNEGQYNQNKSSPRVVVFAGKTSNNYEV